MKVAAAKLHGFVAAPPASIQAFLLFGPDSGMVTAHAQTLARQVVDDDHQDPFNRVRLAPEELRGEGTRVADELAATTLMGGRRVITCLGFGERERPAVEAALDVAKDGDNRLIVTAGDLKPASKLRKLFEADPRCAALACYADEGRNLTDLIRKTLGAAGMEADRDAMSALSNALGADRSLSLRELEKLALYKGAPGRITAEDVIAIISDAAPLGFDTYLFAVTGGDLTSADKELQRLADDGQAPIHVHMALTQHLNRFVQVVDGGGDVAKAVESLRPKIFWKVKERFIAQARRMRGGTLASAICVAHQGGVDLRVNALPPALILSRLTLRLVQLFR